MVRAAGGMISLEHDGVHHFTNDRRSRSKPSVQLPHYKYIEDNDKCITNEHSIYNLSSSKY